MEARLNTATIAAHRHGEAVIRSIEELEDGFTLVSNINKRKRAGPGYPLGSIAAARALG